MRREERESNYRYRDCLASIRFNICSLNGQLLITS